MEKIWSYHLMVSPFLILSTFGNNIEIEIFTITFGFGALFLFSNFSKVSVLIGINLILTWIGTTKGLDSDYAFYHLDYISATNSSFYGYISEHIKSPIFYSIFYLLNYLGLPYRTAVGVIVFLFNAFYFDFLKTLLSRENFIFASLLFLFYFPIFDTSTHLFRQHLGTIFVLWGIVKSRSYLILFGVLTHLSSIVFSSQILISFKKKNIFYLSVLVLICSYLFFDILQNFLVSFIFERFTNTTELEELGLLSYVVIFTAIFPIFDEKYRFNFFVPSISILLVMILLKENSEIVFRFSKYFHYLVPVALIIIIARFSKLFVQERLIKGILLSFTLTFLTIYFGYKLILNPNWEYFNIY